MFRQILRPVIQTARSSTRSYHVPPELKPPHMDELPIPCGSWKEAHSKAETKYNLQLLVGIVTVIGTIAVGRMNGLFWLNFSAPVPKKESES
ncbi:cytochrome c oxidase subunit 7B [Calliopsis andreniformis]|uniref:cytochrome c oxidase subunit 7B n=1 Tax=Calliopsis andreniformis TaxID=337506 RepID=UPI003FCE0F4E